MTERDANPVGTLRGRGEDRPARDYTNIGEVSDPVFARLPAPATVFAARAKRLAAVAEGNPLAPYLVFLSRIAAVQNVAHEVLPPASRPPEVRVPLRLQNGMPPLSKEDLAEGEEFTDTLEWFIQHAGIAGAPEPAEQARRRLQTMSWPERLLLADAIFDGGYPAEQIGESLYVAAALQVHLARQAAGLDAERLTPVGDGVCPACGNPPVASMIVGWANANRARYLCCTLCGTMWNYVRIKCTSCASTAGISYLLIEEQSKDIAVETCASCRGYVKHLHQHRNTQLEPFADDIASFGLDVLAQEEGLRRTTINPLMVFT